MSLLSLSFIGFLLFFILIFYVFPAKTRPWIILAGNIVFYMSFDYRCLLYLMFSIAVAFFCAGKMDSREEKTRKKPWLVLALGMNIGLLIFVKYVPWLLESGGRAFGIDVSGITGEILVPIGISFYTLQVCGYCIDVYREKYRAEKNAAVFAAFASFFPLILQGPISRYDQLGEQIRVSKKQDIYHNLTYGAQLMLWGFFKKLVIADRMALLVNPVFAEYEMYGGMVILTAVLFYSIQIYTDFSGCVDICRGAAQLVGIDVIKNFRQPYFAVSIQDFWKRWHIALSGWFRDYLYIPLGGNRKGSRRKYANILLVFLVSGLWHGVGVHYIIWGLLQGIYQIIGAVTYPVKKRMREATGIAEDSAGLRMVRQLVTFGLLNISWIIFRAESLGAAGGMIGRMLTCFGGSSFPGLEGADFLILLLAVVILAAVSYLHEKGGSVRDAVSKQILPVRWGCYLAMLFAVIVFGVYGPGYSDASFIYMNF